MLQNCLAGEELSHIYWPEVSEVKCSVWVLKKTHRRKNSVGFFFFSNALISSKFTLLTYLFIFAEGSGPFKLLFSCARWHWNFVSRGWRRDIARQRSLLGSGMLYLLASTIRLPAVPKVKTRRHCAVPACPEQAFLTRSLLMTSSP